MPPLEKKRQLEKFLMHLSSFADIAGRHKLALIFCLFISFVRYHPHVSDSVGLISTNILPGQGRFGSGAKCFQFLKSGGLQHPCLVPHLVLFRIS